MKRVRIGKRRLTVRLPSVVDRRVLDMREYGVVVLGAGGVGKSALTVRFVKDAFLEHYNPTIEEHFRREINVNGETIGLDILDTAGAEQFTALNEVYLSSGEGYVLVFSLTQEASLQELEGLRQQILHVKAGEPNVPLVIVGTKMDLYNEREVTRAAIQDLASRWNVPFYETSAKKNWHIQEVFSDLAKQMIVRYPNASPKKRHRKDCVIM